MNPTGHLSNMAMSFVRRLALPLALSGFAFALPACGESTLELIGYTGDGFGGQDAGGGTEVAGDTCTANTCGDHGTCVDAATGIYCVCDDGYRGNTCAQCAGGFVRDEYGDCVQDGGFDWNPDAGGTTQDAGTVVAKTCATAGLSCGSHGSCVDGGGAPYCQCATGWTGSTCSSCASGYNSYNGQCVASCATAGLSCGSHGSCVDNNGTPYCECAAGWTGNGCNTCASGYNSYNGQCVATCATAGLSCGSHGKCSDASGTATCVCSTGWAGTSCDRCASGYQDNDNNGSCLADCASSALSCGSNGSCSDASGAAKCVCNTGYAGSGCTSCASGYQDSDNNGSCLPTCSTAGLSCGSHGTCTHASGTATCVCNAAYTGTGCTSCASGYQDNDNNGTCTANCSTAGLSCGHGSCSDSSGTAKCVCSTGYSGTNCAACASGYQDNDGNGTCLANCATANLSCTGGQTCDDSSGTAKCVSGSSAVSDEWTFMVFLDGDNNLDSQAKNDLDEMYKGLKGAGTTDKVNVIVLHDGDGSSDTKLYKVTNTGKTTLNSGTSIFSGSEADMSSAETMKKFGVWAVKNYPAKKYAFVMWDHGGGWRDGEDGGKASRHCGGKFGLVESKSPFLEAEGFRDFSQDETTGSGMITLADGDYGNALNAIKTQAGKKLSIIGFDACLMGMFEVAAASAPYGDYLVASSESEPGGGWVYDVFLKSLAKTPTMDALTLSKAIVDAYHDKSSSNATLGVYDLSKTSSFQTSLNTFGNQLKSALATSSYKTAIQNVRNSSSLQAYSYNEHVDLKHFITLLQSSSSSLPSALTSAASGVTSSLSSFVVYCKHNNSKTYWGYTHDNSSCMSIFFPRWFGCYYWGSGYVPYSCYPCPSNTCNGCSGDFEDVDSGIYLKTELSGAYKSAGWSSGWYNFLAEYTK